MVNRSLVRLKEKIGTFVDEFNAKFFFAGLACLFWYLLRTGTKPSRATYPCQQAAAKTIKIWFVAYFMPFILLLRRKWKKPMIIITGFLFVFVLVNPIIQNQLSYILAKPKTELILSSQIATESPSTDIFVIQDTNGTLEGIERLMTLMNSENFHFYKSSKVGENKGPDGIIGADSVVLLKINSQWAERGGTNTDLLKSVIEAITNHPDGFTGEVVVVDNGQKDPVYNKGEFGDGGSFDWGNQNNAIDYSQSVRDVVESFTTYQVSNFSWQDITLTEVHEYNDTGEPDHNDDGYVKTGIKYAGSSSTYVSYPKFTSEGGENISLKYGVWNGSSYSDDRLVFINMPVLKTHSDYGVTGCVKNYMGVQSEYVSSAHYYVRYGAMGTLMANTRIPDLNILDCIWVNARPGDYDDGDNWDPINGYTGPKSCYTQAIRLDIIVAGFDPVAIDYWASKNILMQTADIEYPELRTYLLDPDNESSTYRRFSNWLNTTNQILNDAGINTVKDDASINVYLYGAQRTNLNIHAGWTLVGINWIPINANITELFMNHLDKIQSIYSFDEENQIYKIWINGIESFDSLIVLKCGEGYWIKSQEAFTIEISGSGVSDKQFHSGWNLKGLIGNTSQTPEAYLVNETWLQVSQYDSETGQWVHHIKDIGGYVTISPNIGYWVKIE